MRWPASTLAAAVVGAVYELALCALYRLDSQADLLGDLVEGAAVKVETRV